MGEFISYKKFYEQPLKLTENIQSELQKDCYAVFACRHKFAGKFALFMVKRAMNHIALMGCTPPCSLSQRVSTILRM